MTLEVSGLSKRLGGRYVLANVGLHCHGGEIVSITGENGSGKTTLLRILSGMTEPTRGSVAICGRSLRREPVLAKGHLGYVPDGLEVLPELLVSEFLSLVGTLKVDAASARVQTADAVADQQRWHESLGIRRVWGQRLGSLSFGQRKRVLLGAALVGRPELLILDEPTNGLDPDGVRLICSLLEERRQAGLLAVLCTNDLEFQAELACTRCHLSAGQLERVQP
jgi:ABC-type multidrug transport system ATPase subunit